MNTQLFDLLTQLRARLEPCFSPETAAGGVEGPTPSAGHCAAVAVLVRALFGGAFVSTRIDGQSHWFNRIIWDGFVLDVDLTGDQFGRPAVQVVPGALHPDARERDPGDVNGETQRRAALLLARLALSDAASPWHS